MTNVQEVKTLKHFIGGELIDGKSGRFGSVFNPTTGKVIAKVPLANAEETREAIEKAQVAFPQWRDTSVSKRAEIVLRFRNLITENIEELLQIICTESGKTLEDAKGEITRGLESVDLAIGAPQLMKGSIP